MNKQKMPTADEQTSLLGGAADSARRTRRGKIQHLKASITLLALLMFSTPLNAALVDLTSPTGGTITYSQSLSTYEGTKAFDNGLLDSTSRWLANVSALPNVYVQYQFTSGPTLVNAYRVTGLTASSFATRDPKDFNLKGSNNGTDWVPLHSQTGVTGWADGQQRYYEFANYTAYRYYRFTISANNGELQYTGLNELELFSVPVPPAIETLPATNVVSNSGWMNGSLTSTGTATTAVMVYWGASDGGTNAATWANTNVWTAPQVLGNYTYQATGLSTNSTCYFRFSATNSVGKIWSGTTGAFITGEVWIQWVSDGDEATRAPGTFRVFRAAAASQADLVVFYGQTGGTAVSGVDFAALSGSVVIPAGATSALVSVVPLGSYANPNDTTVTLSILPQGYLVGSPDTATLTIENHEVPADKNVWVASAAGNASVAANWSQGVPQTDDDILLGPFSTAAMTWDAGVNGLPTTVKSWTQDSLYTGTVTFPIKYPTFAGAVFTNFTVTGSVTVNGGSWTHPLSLTVTTGSAYTLTQLRANQQYRLCATIGGNLTVGTSGKIDASGKGYYHTAGVNINPAHGGRFSSTSSIAAYGDVKFPQDIGFASNQGTDSASKRAAGGGAILLTVGDAATVDGVISVNGEIKALSVGAGGSIVLKAKSLAGTGSLVSEGLGASDTTSLSGTGGRIAVITTTPVDIAAPTISASVVGRDNCGGCGTIYLKDSTTPTGMLIVRDLKNTGNINGIAMCTPVIAEGDWTFDRIRLGGVARLAVPVGSTLSLPGGLASVFSTDAALRDSILYQGGTLSIGSPATHVVQSNWVFSATSPCVINGNMLVRNGGAIGLAYLVQNIAPASASTLTLQVNGDLEVASTGSIIGTEGGTMLDSNVVPLGYSISSHGGRDGATSKAYGSILNPILPGLGMLNSYGWMRAGAALKLTVTGNLKLDGIAQSDGWNAAGGGPHGSAGSLNFTLGSLSGNGSISAKGTTANAGGRIAIRLTAPGATFDAFGIADITANGPASSCSAGTIYLETAADVANAGRIIVKNNNSTSTVMTPIPANGIMADDPKNLMNASLSVEAKARIDLSANLTLASVALAANTKCELNGFGLVTKAMSVGGVNVPAGTYRAGSSLFTQGYVTDVSAGQTGFVTVKGAVTVIVVK